MHGTRTGIGTALRAARQSRGITLEKASRDTRIHLQYLEALERESFHDLRADVYVRGFLRSYSSYLGLDANKVITVYERAPAKPGVAPPAAPQGNGRDLGAPRRGPHWQLVAALAVGLLALFGAAGLLTRTGAGQVARHLPISVSSAATPSDTVTLKILAAHRAVKAIVIADGVRRYAGTIWYGNGRKFTAQSLLRVTLRPGGAADLVVNGYRAGPAGETSAPYQASFTPRDFRGLSESGSQEATPSASA